VTPKAAGESFDHVVPDLLKPGLRLVFCGTAPSRISKERRAYYANPGNRFWATLHEVGLTPRRFAPAEYPALLALGIGLTDLNKREWGNDDALTPAGFDVPGFAAKMRRFGPLAVGFTSKTAGSIFLGRDTGDIAYGAQPERIGATRLFVLPSTSGQAVRYFDIKPWHVLSREVAGP
jgi:TDG/mug DNA glycosylase family protein